MTSQKDPKHLLFWLIAMLWVIYAIAAYFVLWHWSAKINESDVELEHATTVTQTLTNTWEVCREDTCRTVEVAKTEEERSIGLMWRDSMPKNHGMLFTFDEPKDWGFWMKNTLIPLDIIWLDSNFVVVDYVTMQPCTSDPCPTAWPRSEALYVLELNANQAKNAWFEPGSVLRYTPSQE